MIKVMVIHGKEAIKEFESSGMIPSLVWLEENGGAVCEKEFDTLAEYRAYVDALEENDGYDDWRMTEPVCLETDRVPVQRSLYRQLQELSRKFVDELRCLPFRPDGWLPHIVYVEEEGDYPVYTMYKLEEIREDASCTLFNPETNERFHDRHLHEINIDWLDTVLRRYHECCIEQGLITTRS